MIKSREVFRCRWMGRSDFFVKGGIAIFSLLIAGCAGSHQHMNVKSKVVGETNESVIEDASLYLEKFGSISISPPLLTKPDELFQFDLPSSFDAGKYYEDAKSGLQGKASIFSQKSMIIGANGTIKLDPTAAASYQQEVKKHMEREEQNKVLSDLQRQRNEAIDEVAKEDLDYQLQKAREIESVEARAIAIDAAINQYKNRVSTLDMAETTYPTLLGNNVPDLKETTFRASEKTSFAKDKFSDFGKLLSGDKMSITDRVALSIAQGDNAMEAIFRLYGDAKKIDGYDSVLYGTSLVSVNPGWQTEHGYHANLSVIPEIRYIEARKEIKEKYLSNNLDQKACIEKLLAKPTVNSPDFTKDSGVTDPCDEKFYKAKSENKLNATAINVISPLTTSQTHELGNSQRDQVEISLALALALRSAGKAVQANTFLDYAKSIQKDFQTVSTENTINVSSSGIELNVEVGPVFQAMRSPGSDESVGGRLQRQSFPVLFIIGLQKFDYKVGVFREYQENEKRWKLKIMEPVLYFTQMQHWNRNHSSIVRKGAWGKAPDRDSMLERLAISKRLSSLNTSLKKCIAKKEKGDDQAKEDCKARKIASLEDHIRLSRSLRIKMTGGYTQYHLKEGFLFKAVKQPKTDCPIVKKVIPSSVKLSPAIGQKAVITLIGKSLGTSHVKDVLINRDHRIINTDIEHIGDTAIRIRNVPIAESASPLIFFLKSKKASCPAINTSGLPVLIGSLKSVKASQSSVKVMHKVKKLKDGSETIQLLSVDSKVNAEQLNGAVDIFKSEIEKGKVVNVVTETTKQNKANGGSE